MAGSYHHCREDDGTFTFDLIENMGDAHEACEMMFWMINRLATDEQIKQVEEEYFAAARASGTFPLPLRRP